MRTGLLVVVLLAAPLAGCVGPADPTPQAAEPSSTEEPGGFSEWDVYDRPRLEPGYEAAGPAVIEAENSTTVVPPGDHVTVDIPERDLAVDLSEEELAERREEWEAPEPQYEGGILAKYARDFAGASDGAVTNPRLTRDL
jgi:hypothetical protein